MDYTFLIIGWGFCPIFSLWRYLDDFDDLYLLAFLLLIVGGPFGALVALFSNPPIPEGINFNPVIWRKK